MNIRERMLQLANDAEDVGAMDLHYALLYLAGTMDDRGESLVGVKWPGRGVECGIGLRAAARLREARAELVG